MDTKTHGLLSTVRINPGGWGGERINQAQQSRPDGLVLKPSRARWPPELPTRGAGNRSETSHRIAQAHLIYFPGTSLNFSIFNHEPL